MESPGLFCKIELPHKYHREREGLPMTECNTNLMEELLSGGNANEIFRQEIEERSQRAAGGRDYSISGV